MKILVIEDNKDVRENICEILELAEYETEAAENGVEGIRKAKASKPDLILCDVMMPKLDGYGVMKILNDVPSLYDVPLIFLTAKTEMADIRKGMGLGAEDYILKPFDDTELLQSIDTRIKKAKRLKENSDQEPNQIRHFFDDAKGLELLNDLAQNAESRKYKKEALLYEEGQQARYLFFILQGRVKVSRMNDQGKELILHMAQKKEFLAYAPLIEDRYYSNSARCMTDCEIAIIPKKDFLELLYNDKDFYFHFIKKLTQRLEITETRLIDMAYGSVRQKVAKTLIYYLDKTEETDTASFEALREDMAATAGTAKETLIRTLSDLKKEKIIRIDGSMLTVLEPLKLKKIAEM